MTLNHTSDISTKTLGHAYVKNIAFKRHTLDLLQFFALKSCLHSGASLLCKDFPAMAMFQAMLPPVSSKTAMEIFKCTGYMKLLLESSDVISADLEQFQTEPAAYRNERHYFWHDYLHVWVTILLF